MSFHVWPALLNKRLYELYVGLSPMHPCPPSWSCVSFQVPWSIRERSVLNSTGTVQARKILALLSFQSSEVSTSCVYTSSVLTDIFLSHTTCYHLYIHKRWYTSVCRSINQSTPNSQLFLITTYHPCHVVLNHRLYSSSFRRRKCTSSLSTIASE